MAMMLDAQSARTPNEISLKSISYIIQDDGRLLLFAVGRQLNASRAYLQATKWCNIKSI